METTSELRSVARSTATPGRGSVLNQYKTSQFCTEPRSQDSLNLQELYQLLNSLKESTGDFACSGFLPELSCSPGLVIENVGHISLPVQNEQAQKIIEVANKAPFGLGAQTLVDETVRKTWQLDPSQISIKNDLFLAGVENVVSAVKKHLGCNKRAVQAKLYKVLMYERGGHFNSHRDTEKEPGMFATMVIQLPSMFEGGQLTVRHAGQEKVVEMDGDRSAYCCKYAAHYCDCEHQVSEVTSGYRLALVYSLCWTASGDPPSANAGADIARKVAKVLPEICVGERNLFSWFLSHKYSESGLSGSGIDALKGADEAVARALQQANELLPEEQQFEFYIAEVKRELQQHGDFDCGRNWVGEFYATGDEDEEVSIENWFEFDGEPADLEVDSIELDIENEVVNFRRPNNIPIKRAIEQFWGDADEEDNTGPTGNEGATQTYWYNSYAIFAWQKDNAVNLRIKLNGYDAAVTWVADELKRVETLDLSTAEYKQAMSDLKKVIDFAISNNVSLSSREVSSMLTLLTSLRSEAILLANLFITDVMGRSQSSRTASPHCLGDGNIIQPLIQLTLKLSWPSVSESLKKMFVVSPVVQHGKWALFLKLLFQESKDKKVLLEDACFMSIVTSLLEKIDVRDNQLESADAMTKVNAVASLLFCIGDGDLLTKFTNAILAYSQQSPKSTMLQTLVQSLEKRKLGNNQFWIQLLKFRIAQLADVEKIEMRPFTWNQDEAVLNGHPRVEAFLRGPLQTMKYQVFTGIGQARSFASTNFGTVTSWGWPRRNAPSRSYSATATSGGSGQRAFVLIEKTREWYDKKVAPVKQQLEELKKLQNMFNPVSIPPSSLATEQLEPQAKKRAVDVVCIE